MAAATAAPMTGFPANLAPLVRDIEATGHGLVMTMGKGGVGKTTVAASIAVTLARRGHKVQSGQKVADVTSCVG